MSNEIKEVASALGIELSSIATEKDGTVILNDGIDLKNLIIKDRAKYLDQELSKKLPEKVEEMKRSLNKDAYAKFEGKLKELGANVPEGVAGAWEVALNDLIAKTKQEQQTSEESILNSTIFQEKMKEKDSKIDEITSKYLSKVRETKQAEISRIEDEEIINYLNANASKLNLPSDQVVLQNQLKGFKATILPSGIEKDVENGKIVLKQGNEIYKEDYVPKGFDHFLNKTAPAFFGLKSSLQTVNTTESSESGSSSESNLKFKTEAEFLDFMNTETYQKMSGDEQRNLIKEVESQFQK